MARFRVAALAAASVVLVTGAGCSGSDDDAAPMCRSAGEASVCVYSESGTGYEVTGKGFRPRSEVGLDVASGGGRMIPVDGDGRFPAGGATLGFLPGPEVEQHRIEGVDASGRTVTFVVTCSLTEDKQPTCWF